MTADASVPVLLTPLLTPRYVPGSGDAAAGGNGVRAPGTADPIERVRAALSDIAAGRPVVVSDEDGGDLVVASELATPQLMSFMIRHTSGFLCVAVTDDEADRLDLPLMARTAPRAGGAAQCVAVDARTGVSTGISAADRATTVRLLAAPDTVATDLARPGHVVPLRVGADGVLGHRGRAEAAIDLAGLAGLSPSAALCALVSATDPTRMASGPELDRFARAHGLQRIAVSDLVAYRMRFDKLVERRAVASMPLTAGLFRAVGYGSRLDGSEHLALVHGTIGDGNDVPVHVHRECVLGDTFGSSACGCAERLRSAVAGIADEGRGVVVYLREAQGHLPLLHEDDVAPARGDRVPVTVDDWLREHSTAGQILRDLGVRTTRPVTGNLRVQHRVSR